MVPILQLLISATLSTLKPRKNKVYILKNCEIHRDTVKWNVVVVVVLVVYKSHAFLLPTHNESLRLMFLHGLLVQGWSILIVYYILFSDM